MGWLFDEYGTAVLPLKALDRFPNKSIGCEVCYPGGGQALEYARGAGITLCLPPETNLPGSKKVRHFGAPVRCIHSSVTV